jgi:hypothetical protein
MPHCPLARRPCNQAVGFSRRVLSSMQPLRPIPRTGEWTRCLGKASGVRCGSSSCVVSGRTAHHDWTWLLPPWPVLRRPSLPFCATEGGGEQERITEPRTLHRRPRWALGDAGLLSLPRWVQAGGLVFPASPWWCTRPGQVRSTSRRTQCCRLLGAQRSSGRELGALS